MTVSCKFSSYEIRYKNRLLLETSLQDFEKRQLLPKVNKTVDSLQPRIYNRDMGRGF